MRLVANSGQHVFESLRQDDQPQGLSIAQSQRAPGLALSSVDGHDAAAHDLSQICRGVDAKGHDGYEHLAHVGSGKDDIIYNKKLHHRRRAADDDEIEPCKGR